MEFMMLDIRLLCWLSKLYYQGLENMLITSLMRLMKDSSHHKQATELASYEDFNGSDSYELSSGLIADYMG